MAKKIARGEVDGLVDVGASGVHQERAGIDAHNGLADHFTDVGKWKLEIGVLGEIDDRGLIEWREGPDEFIGGGAHFR